ncbi:MAG: hypothetical protein AB1Z63_04800 [Candidatus Limnocylindrales bacterium]
MKKRLVLSLAIGGLMIGAIAPAASAEPPPPSVRCALDGTTQLTGPLRNYNVIQVVWGYGLPGDLTINDPQGNVIYDGRPARYDTPDLSNPPRPDFVPEVGVRNGFGTYISVSECS